MTVDVFGVGERLIDDYPEFTNAIETDVPYDSPFDAAVTDAWRTPAASRLLSQYRLQAISCSVR